MTDTTAPHVSGGGENAPLSELIRQGLSLMGDSSSKRSTGDLEHLLLLFANMVIDEVRAHPYWDGTVVPYYVNVADKRDIPDMIVVTGLAAKYATQQVSQKAGALLNGPSGYYKILNRKLLERKIGLNATLELRPLEQSDGSQAENEVLDA